MSVFHLIADDEVGGRRKRVLKCTHARFDISLPTYTCQSCMQNHVQIICVPPVPSCSRRPLDLRLYLLTLHACELSVCPQPHTLEIACLTNDALAFLIHNASCICVHCPSCPFKRNPSNSTNKGNRGASTSIRSTARHMYSISPFVAHIYSNQPKKHNGVRIQPSMHATLCYDYTTTTARPAHTAGRCI